MRPGLHRSPGEIYTSTSTTTWRSMLHSTRRILHLASAFVLPQTRAQWRRITSDAP